MRRSPEGEAFFLRLEAFSSVVSHLPIPYGLGVPTTGPIPASWSHTLQLTRPFETVWSSSLTFKDKKQAQEREVNSNLRITLMLPLHLLPEL